MSGSKIKAKDLSYDSSLPPFLQRLHDQKAGRGDIDRHERPVARARRAKDPNDDDEPTVVDESGETVSKEEYEKMTRLSNDGVEDAENTEGDVDPSTSTKTSGALPEKGDMRTENKVTDGTAQKKRKVAKVIGGEEESEHGSDSASSTKKVVKKAKKKVKLVTLAFDDDEGL